MLKQRSTLFHLIAFFGFIFFLSSCRKDQIENITLSTANVNAAKDWFTHNGIVLNKEGNWLNKISPNWNDVNVSTTAAQNIYEVMLNNPEQVFLVTSTVLPEQAEGLAKRSILKLLVLEDKLTNTFTSCIMVAVAGESFNLQNDALAQLHYQNYNDFTGVVYFYEINGKLANGWGLEKGKIIANISPTIATTLLAKNLNATNATSGSKGNGSIMNMAPPVECGTQTVSHWRLECITVGPEGESYTKCEWERYSTTITLYCPADGGDGGYVPPSGGTQPTDNPEQTQPEYICDCQCPLDEELVDVNLAWEPKWGQLGNLTDIKNEITKVMSETNNFDALSFSSQIEVLKTHFSGNRLFGRNNEGKLYETTSSKQVNRYIYTANNGWIDMHHFFYAAFYADSDGPASAYIQLVTAEHIQANFGQQQASAFSYEDIPSNVAGILFWKKYNSDIKSGTKTLMGSVTEYLTSMSPKQPSEAPNFGYIPHVVDGHVPKNRTAKGLIGEALRNAAKASFCEKSESARRNIIEAHKILPSKSIVTLPLVE